MLDPVELKQVYMIWLIMFDFNLLFKREGMGFGFKGCKIAKVCLIILRHCASKG